IRQGGDGRLSRRGWRSADLHAGEWTAPSRSARTRTEDCACPGSVTIKAAPGAGSVTPAGPDHDAARSRLFARRGGAGRTAGAADHAAQQLGAGYRPQRVLVEPELGVVITLFGFSLHTSPRQVGCGSS